MSLFKISKGNSSRIGTDTTPFQDGSVYFASDNGGLYIDTEENGEQRRVRVTSEVQEHEHNIANADELGFVKSGGDITIDSNGIMSVEDDSHNHTISNVDGLQDTLNEKASVTFVRWE